MPRKKAAEKRPRKPDPLFWRYGRFAVHQLLDGTRQKVRGGEHFLRRPDFIEKKHNQKGLDVFYKAIGNVKPSLEVKSRRVGGATYQVPVEVPSDRRTALAFRWIIGFSRSRSEKTMAERLAAEFLSAAKNEGAAVKKREDTHRMAEANKAFAHFRW